MSRRRESQKRHIQPDPLYGDLYVAKFTNCLMRDGKKAVAEKVLYGALDLIHDRTREDPVMIFRQAVDNCEPRVEVKSRRVGGSTYQVPIEVSSPRRVALSMRWLIQFARKRGGRSMREKLANEILEASHGRGGAIKKRDDVHRMAEANKAFAHYRW